MTDVSGQGTAVPSAPSATISLSKEKRDEIDAMIERHPAMGRLSDGQKWYVAIFLAAYTAGAAAILGFIALPIVKQTAELAANRETLDMVADGLRKRNDFVTAIKGDTSHIPKGAVLAFDRSEGCPTGWRTFAPATARFIVGAGTTFEGGLSRDNDGQPLSPKAPREAKGQENHKLLKAELPAEPVQITVFQSPEGSLGGGYPIHRFIGGDGIGATGAFVEKNSKPLGRGEPYSTLPPYIALLYCVKEVSE